MSGNPTLYLVDGTALAYRAYFAFIKNPLINSHGENTSASFGFTNTMLSLIRNSSPDYLAVVFDTGKPTFRHEMYDEYKATRQKMPDDMVDQIPRIKEAADALGVVRMEMDGYEADDIIGTLALEGEKSGFDVVMVTGDKDFMQLVNDRINMYIPMKDEIVGPDGVQAKFSVSPAQVIDLLALMGDSSDNVPGLPRVGQKTAVALLEQFGTLDAVLDRPDEIKKPSIRKTVEENRDLALLSRKLVTIKTDVPVDVDMEKLRFDGIAEESSREFFREMEFTRLYDSLEKKAEDVSVPVTVVAQDTIDAFFADVSAHDVIAFDLETTSVDAMKAEIVGVSFAAGDHSWYLPFAHDEGENLDWDLVFPRLKELCESSEKAKTGHNAKYDATILRRYGIETSPISCDTMLAAYVLDPGSRGYALDKLADAHLNHRMQSITELIGKGKKQLLFSAVDIDSAARYSGDDAATTLRLLNLFMPRIAQEGLDELFRTVEMPLLGVLMDMEMHGVSLDVPLLKGLSEEFAHRMDALEVKIYESAGEEFNINSPKQLGVILFEKLELKARRKTKTGYSTDIDTLTSLIHDHELPGLILDYRQLAKLKSTYVDALPEMVNEKTCRVHTSYNQAVAATGRLSSSDPNLQNIPIRTDMGRQIRQAFVAPEGYVLLSADYSQIELRIMAHISGDGALKEAFVNGEDVHRRTASYMFHTFPEMVTDEQRRQAKTINFGVMYGMGAYALSEQLGITRKEAKAFIDNYFATHTGVARYFEETVEGAERNGYVTTLLGRKRYVTDINATNRNVAEFAKRMAVNTPIQGSAADLIKLSMIELSRRLKDSSLDAAMILQVHDELVLEVAESDVEETTMLVREVMEGAMELTVPLIVDIGTGNNWLEAH